MDKSVPLPYACISNCPKFYKWYDGLERCLRVEGAKEVSIGEAAMVCANDHGRLASLKDCKMLEVMAESITASNILEGKDARLWIGNSALGEDNIVTRNWHKDKSIDSHGYGTETLDRSCQVKEMSSMPRKEAAFSMTFDSDGFKEMSFEEMERNNYGDDRPKAGFVCERDGKIFHILGSFRS